MKKTFHRCILTIVSCAAATLVVGCASTSDTVTGPTGQERPAVTAPPPSAPDQASCAAANAQWTLGLVATDELLERARVAARATSARFLISGHPITTEYLGARLNLEIDVRRLVVAVRCG